MCKCFIRGLTPEIEQRIARNLNVHETVADALRIERELHSMTDLRQGHSNTASKKPDTNKLHETCQICYKEGHSASNCRKITIQRPVKVIQGNNIICQLCFKFGHNAKFCKTNSNINNNIQNKSSIICQWCDKSGHSANNCWKKQNEQNNSKNMTKIVYEEVEVQVPTLRLKSLNELFDNDSSSIEMQNPQKEIANLSYPSKKYTKSRRQESFRTPLVNSTPVGCKKGSNQTLLCNATQFNEKESKEKSSTLEIKLPRIGISAKNDIHKNNSSHVTIDELIKRTQSYNPYLKVRNSKANKPSSKILASTQAQSQEIIEKFMRKRKSKRKEKTEEELSNDITRECFALSEKPNKNRLTEIVELLRLEHLNTQEKGNIINLISNSQDDRT
ncbi:hypothetical protein ALC57_01287 [Trachymyrmex cornetzi]|uniref:CCHC-type domain-containing protein n=1 Tax=Trachymyrmex cornetzi TaxID=471704 RepID=A0A151JPW5_9HYME|nr:hypothetical protein ALC57_01287 [Trachymyrmex cornetzi]